MADLPPLVRTTARSLRDEGVQLARTSVLALCSGGPDSVALVDVLATLPRGVRPGVVIVCFLDHGLRPVDDDLAAAGAVAARHGLELVERSAAPGELRGSMQTTARSWRYSSALEIAEELKCAVIATGHHADDQMETALAALTSSSGLRSIGGMRIATTRSGRTHLRPLLHASRRQIERHLDSRRIVGAMDPSNADPDACQRNHLRWRVVPELLAAHPGSGANLLRSVRQVADLDLTIGGLTRAVLEGAVAADGALDIRGVVTMPDGARAAVIAEWLRRAGLGRGVTARVVRAVDRLVNGDDGHAVVDVRGARIARDRYLLRTRPLESLPRRPAEKEPLTS